METFFAPAAADFQHGGVCHAFAAGAKPHSDSMACKRYVGVRSRDGETEGYTQTYASLFAAAADAPARTGDVVFDALYEAKEKPSRDRMFRVILGPIETERCRWRRTVNVAVGEVYDSAHASVPETLREPITVTVADVAPVFEHLFPNWRQYPAVVPTKSGNPIHGDTIPAGFGSAHHRHYVPRRSTAKVVFRSDGNYDVPDHVQYSCSMRSGELLILIPCASTLAANVPFGMVIIRVCESDHTVPHSGAPASFVRTTGLSQSLPTPDYFHDVDMRDVDGPQALHLLDELIREQPHKIRAIGELNVVPEWSYGPRIIDADTIELTPTVRARRDVVEDSPFSVPRSSGDPSNDKEIVDILGSFSMTTQPDVLAMSLVDFLVAQRRTFAFKPREDKRSGLSRPSWFWLVLQQGPGGTSSSSEGALFSPMSMTREYADACLRMAADTTRSVTSACSFVASAGVREAVSNYGSVAGGEAMCAVRFSVPCKFAVRTADGVPVRHLPGRIWFVFVETPRHVNGRVGMFCVTTDRPEKALAAPRPRALTAPSLFYRPLTDFA